MRPDRIHPSRGPSCETLQISGNSGAWGQWKAQDCWEASGRASALSCRFVTLVGSEALLLRRRGAAHRLTVRRTRPVSTTRGGGARFGPRVCVDAVLHQKRGEVLWGKNSEQTAAEPPKPLGASSATPFYRPPRSFSLDHWWGRFILLQRDVWGANLGDFRGTNPSMGPSDFAKKPTPRPLSAEETERPAKITARPDNDTIVKRLSRRWIAFLARRVPWASGQHPFCGPHSRIKALRATPRKKTM